VPFRKNRKSNDEVIDRLSGVAFFEGFDEKELARVAELAEVVEAEEGTHLTEQGKPGLECFVVLEGHAGVYVGSDKIAVNREGEVVGEMALIEHGPRIATVIAESPMRLLQFDAKRFRMLLDEMPKASKKVMSELSRRLRERDLQQ
jgi:CRP/FNR family transcriptional regulator, cyclic AMP receptor protein